MRFIGNYTAPVTYLGLYAGCVTCAPVWVDPGHVDARLTELGHRQAAAARVSRVDPNSPENIEARQRAVELTKQCTFAGDTRSWIQKLKDRHEEGEILPYQQLQILKQRGLA